MSLDLQTSRRQTLKRLLASAASASILGQKTVDAALSAFANPSIDAHAHVFHRGLKLTKERRYAPDYDARVDHYLHELDVNEISHGVIIQPSFLGTDNSYLVESLAATKGRLRGVAVVDPSTPMDELMRLDAVGVVGVRLNLIGRPSPDLSELIWREHLAKLAQLDWQVEVQCPASQHVLLAPRLLDAGVNVVVDHYGLPDPELGADDPSFARLISLGATRRLWFKISAAYRIGPEGEAIAAAAYRRLREQVGLDRLLWGSDWPHTAFERRQNFRMNRQFLERLASDPAESGQVLSAGAKLFRI